MSGAAASLALPPFFIVPAICFLSLPVWRVINANSRVEAIGIFGAVVLVGFGVNILGVAFAHRKRPGLWFLTPFLAFALALVLSDLLGCCGGGSWIPHASALVRVLCLLAAFALIEWTRSFVASGFPWSLMEAFLPFT